MEFFCSFWAFSIIPDNTGNDVFCMKNKNMTAGKSASDNKRENNRFAVSLINPPLEELQNIPFFRETFCFCADLRVYNKRLLSTF